MIVLGIDPGARSVGFGLTRGRVVELGGAAPGSRRFSNEGTVLWGGYHLGSRDDDPGAVATAFVAKLAQQIDPETRAPYKPDTAVIEVPQTYNAGQQKGRQQDLISVALVAGAVAGALKQAFPSISILLVFPRDWKGTVDPDVFTERINGRLSAEEKARLDHVTATYRHNMIDGVGLSLFFTTRLKPRKNYYD